MSAVLSSGPVDVRRADGNMTWRTALWLAASGGRADGTRIALTALGAAVGTLSLLCAVTVVATGAGDGPYTSDLLNQSGLHPGIVAVFVLLCVPTMAFVGQCSRIGAPARDRRLATVRLQGGTPSDVVRIAAGETGFAALLGAALGTAVFFALRQVLGHPVTTTYVLQRRTDFGNGSIGYEEEKITGPALRFPTDVLPARLTLVLVIVAVPLVAAVFTALALRRVTVTPFGVVRREEHRPANAGPLLLFVGGTVVMGGYAGLVRLAGIGAGSGTGLGVVLFLVFVATGVGLVLSTTAVSAVIGRVLTVAGDRPSLLIAGRRLLATPGQSARAHAALLLMVLLWAFEQGVNVQILTSVDQDDSFYAGALALVDLAFAVGAAIAAAGLLVGAVEGALTRRRVLAALIAVGTPRGVLYRAALIETMAPLVPAVLAATAAGILGARGALGTAVQQGSQEMPLRVPWASLGLISGGTLLAVLLITTATLPLLRSSTDPAELRAE